MTNEVLAKRIAELERQLSDERMKNMRLEEVHLSAMEQWKKESPAELNSEILNLKTERDALVAQVEALATNRDAFREAAYKAISIIQVNNIRLPQGYGDECLRELQAEAGRAGFLEGVRQMCENEIGMLGHDAESCANHYAAKVRQGGAG